MLYADLNYYLMEHGGSIPADTIHKYLRYAQEKIDTATYNRIVYYGFENLTAFQQEKIRQAVCLQADYMYENGIEPAAVESYNVLDISVSVGSGNTGAARFGMSSMALELLQKTGLCCRVL